MEDKILKTVNSPQVNKERIFHVHLLAESFCIVFQKYILRQSFRLSLVLNLFLIVHQFSGSCSYKTALVEKECTYLTKPEHPISCIKFALSGLCCYWKFLHARMPIFFDFSIASGQENFERKITVRGFAFKYNH